ncbi:hypothetical protein [Domibacillus mangrovi]|uniref:Bacteriophage lambda head decoration protein D n=1 Tax=Domibacillus mangrovi TaxID=1714354 RepID=A0A1Q5P412_9BACI|nr:hypothetical protein [Domibacillus mangrovi]OKL37000.1 hypothetical protein BLL40_05255 [Domibacillus mangrovi]
MNLQPRKGEPIFGQKEFMRNTQGMEVKTAGATLLATDFTAGTYVKAGTAVFKGVDGLYHPVAVDTPATMEGAGLTMHDVKIISGSNPIVGILAAGHPRESRCTGVTDNFKVAVKGRIVFDI